MSLQEEIIKRLKVKPRIDAQEEIRKSIDFMKAYLLKYDFLESLVLGISGGQDSTLCGKLAQMAIDELKAETGKGYRFIALRLPYGIQRDMDDVESAIKYINPDMDLTINIKDGVDRLEEAILVANTKITDFNKGNIKARVRMLVQYSVAAEYKGVVLGTDHAAENVMGFFTKYGDGSADLMPLQRLNKRQGKLLLMNLACPSHLYEKIPTADLEDDRPLLPDEVALGLSYDDIDDYLEGKKVPVESKERIERTFLNSEHKRHMPISIYDEFWK